MSSASQKRIQNVLYLHNKKSGNARRIPGLNYIKALFYFTICALTKITWRNYKI